MKQPTKAEQIKMWLNAYATGQLSYNAVVVAQLRKELETL